MMRRALTLLLLLAFPLCLGGLARADDSGTDPEERGAKLDIKSVSNEADEEYVTYRVDTYEPYHNVEDFSFFRWFFDLNDDGRFADLCIRLEAVGDGRLRAMLYPKCGGESWSTAEAKKIDDRTLEFKLPTRDLVVGGGVEPGEPFKYTVASEDIQGKTDLTPDRGSIVQSGLPEPASLFVTPAPGDGAGGGEGGGEGAGATGGDQGIKAIPVLGDIAEVIDNVPIGVLVVGIVLAGAVLGGVIVLRVRSRPVLSESPRDDSDHGRNVEPQGGEDAKQPPPAAGLWWEDPAGDAPRVHTPDT